MSKCTETFGVSRDWFVDGFEWLGVAWLKGSATPRVLQAAGVGKCLRQAARGGRGVTARVRGSRAARMVAYLIGRDTESVEIIAPTMGA